MKKKETIMPNFINELTGTNDFRPETKSSANASLNQLNPSSVLDKDDFLKLFLVELQNQDPTSPMETDKMVSQTADLTAVESQQNMQVQLEKLVGTFQNSANFNSIGVVGKIADTGLDAFATSQDGEEVPFDLFFENDFISANIEVKDSTGTLVKTIVLDEDSAGIKNLTWDGTDNSTLPASAGVYNITATYKNSETLETQSTKLGVFQIESMRFVGEEAEVKLGNDYVPLSSIREIQEPGKLIGG
jgi:flagellar basal-body rod modification protein FlgD